MSIDIHSLSADPRGRALSNFSPHTFVLDGEKFACVEAFIQGIKFPETDPTRERVFKMNGRYARSMGPVARTYGHRFVWWGGRKIPFGSQEHYGLIERAIRAKFQQNQDALRALLATQGEELTHNIVHRQVISFPCDVFIEILVRIRDEYSSSRN